MGARNAVGNTPTAAAVSVGFAPIAAGGGATADPALAKAPTATRTATTIVILWRPDAARQESINQLIRPPLALIAPAVQRVQLRPPAMVEIEYVPALHPDPLA